MPRPRRGRKEGRVACTHWKKSWKRRKREEKEEAPPYNTLLLPLREHEVRYQPLLPLLIFPISIPSFHLIFYQRPSGHAN